MAELLAFEVGMLLTSRRHDPIGHSQLDATLSPEDNDPANMH